MMKRIYTLLTLFCLAGTSIAQNSSQNYVRSRTMQNETGTSYMDHIEYYDGLGRPFQTVQTGVTPLSRNLVTLREYDNLGRELYNWLPVQSTSNYISPTSFPSNAATSYAQESRPFSQAVYEPLPSDRVVAQYSPGQAWIGKAVETEYLLNGTSAPLNCHRYSVNGSILSVNGDYDAGQLYVTKMKDEDGHLSYQFTNKQNQIILTRQQDGDTTHDTYYVYDDFNNLRFVLQPMYQTSPDLALYAFQYKYDDRNLCIEKRLPGDNLITYVYDNADRQVFSQDSKQRVSGKWTFYLYDKLNRLTVQGECVNTNITSARRAVITCALCKNSVGVVASGLGNSGYNSTFSLSLPIIHTINYYDDYTFRTLPGFSDSNFSDGSYVKGLLTGSVTTILDKETQLYAANYYDNKGRVTRTVQSNQLGGYETTTTTYTFTGQPLNVKHVHTASGKTTQTEEYDYTYDHAERLTEVEHTLNGSKVTLNATTYDFLGRLESRTPHGIAANKLTYRYNIRGWLTEISSNPFTQTLHYTDGLETPCYNGNISSMTWKAGNETTERGYKFTYDGLSRMKNATYGEGASLTTNSNRFSEQVLEYDKTGNILGLLRYGQTSDTGYGIVDNLNLTYTGNQLNKVTDAVMGSVYNGGFEFKDSADQATEYEYDKNGNLTKDLNKKIAGIQYNLLNLPNRVTFEDGSSIEYVYDANGTKLRTVHTINGVTQTTDYCGTVIYENGVAKTLLTEAGYVSLNDNKYHYFIQDHQGNNRVVTDQNGTVEETNHYYPFGGVFANSTSIQPYKYNGKELDRKNGLDWYDYGARQYDAALGRWNTVDPLSEKRNSLSPYSYCQNNPVVKIDPSGMLDDWFLKRNGDIWFDKNIKSQADLKKGEKYLGIEYAESDGTTYRRDGSILFRDETKAYNRMVDHSKSSGNETFSALTNKGVLMLPEYKNDATTVDLNDYKYSMNNGNIVDSFGETFKTYGTVHTHLNSSGPSTSSHAGLNGGSNGDEGFAKSNPYKPVFVLQMGNSEVSFIYANKKEAFEPVFMKTTYHYNNALNMVIKGQLSLLDYSKNMRIIK